MRPPGRAARTRRLRPEPSVPGARHCDLMSKIRRCHFDAGVVNGGRRCWHEPRTLGPHFRPGGARLGSSHFGVRVPRAGRPVSADRQFAGRAPMTCPDRNSQHRLAVTVHVRPREEGRRASSDSGGSPSGPLG